MKTDLHFTPHQGQGFYVTIHSSVKNVSGKPVRGSQFGIMWLDTVEEIHVTGVLEGQPFKLDQERKIGWNDPASGQRYTGMFVFPWKVLFEDGTRWNWTYETSQGCFGEFWKDGKHPRLTTLPMEAKEKIMTKLDTDQK